MWAPIGSGKALFHIRRFGSFNIPGSGSMLVAILHDLLKKKKLSGYVLHIRPSCTSDGNKINHSISKEHRLLLQITRLLSHP